LKEDRNNLELVVKFADLTDQLDGYQAAYNILGTIFGLNKGHLTNVFYALFFQRKIEHKALPVVSSYISLDQC
jgi:hypothetical protein